MSRRTPSPMYAEYETPAGDCAFPMMKIKPCHGLGSSLVFFFVFLVATWLLLFSVRPSWVRRAGLDKTDIDNIDYPKLLWVSALIALGLMVLVYVVGCLY